MKTAVFPGSFDPFTVGHESIVKRGLALSDKIIIAVGYNAEKNGFFSLEARKKMIRDTFRGVANVEVESYEILTIDYCRQKDARFLIRGLRTAADFEYERAIAQVNKAMATELESVFLLCAPEHTPVNSSIVRDIIRHNGNADKFVPAAINYREYINL